MVVKEKKESKEQNIVLNLNREEAEALCKLSKNWCDLTKKIPYRKKDREAVNITVAFLEKIVCEINAQLMEVKENV